jgi:hypothetical protein
MTWSTAKDLALVLYWVANEKTGTTIKYDVLSNDIFVVGGL